MYAVAFNPRSPQLVATADGQGCVKIWRLSGALSTMVAREQELLDRLAAPRGLEQAAADADEEEDADAEDGYDDFE